MQHTPPPLNSSHFPIISPSIPSYRDSLANPSESVAVTIVDEPELSPIERTIGQLAPEITKHGHLIEEMECLKIEKNKVLLIDVPQEQRIERYNALDEQQQRVQKEALEIEKAVSRQLTIIAEMFKFSADESRMGLYYSLTKKNICIPRNAPREQITAITSNFTKYNQTVPKTLLEYVKKVHDRYQNFVLSDYQRLRDTAPLPPNLQVEFRLRSLGDEIHYGVFPVLAILSPNDPQFGKIQAVYKERSGKLEKTLNDLCESLNALHEEDTAVCCAPCSTRKSSLRNPLSVYRVLDYDDSSIHAFIEGRHPPIGVGGEEYFLNHRNMTDYFTPEYGLSDSTLRKCAAQFPVLVTLATHLRLSDLHYENILISDDRGITIIDAEARTPPLRPQESHLCSTKNAEDKVVNNAPRMTSFELAILEEFKNQVDQNHYRLILAPTSRIVDIIDSGYEIAKKLRVLFKDHLNELQYNTVIADHVFEGLIEQNLMQGVSVPYFIIDSQGSIHLCLSSTNIVKIAEQRR